MPKSKRPKISILHDEIPKHVQELMHLTRLAEMGRLSASVAHEINTPLMVAQGFAENIELLLDKDVFPREEIRMQVLEIIKSCQRMSRIINKMNRMSRNQKLRLHIVDVAEVALNAVDFIKVQLAEFDVQLEFNFDQPLPIKCDAVQIEQIILNILSNALHALEQNPQDRKIRISFEEVGDWQCLRVWNNGPLIPKDVMEQLMTPFFSTKDDQGTGLGLAVSKAIMQVHDGDLTCSSNSKEGTEFVLSFPRPATNPWLKSERSQAGSVVLIDRQQNYRKTLHEKFRLLGFEVHSYQDYNEGIQAAIAKRALGVFIDVIPGMPESAAYVKKLRQELGPTALIFTMSNYPSARDMKYELKTSGATDCFEKPIHADNFVYILRLLDTALDAAQPALKNAA
jgi:two-component sensor histidine kinase/ActR/RegA family two-component response regulator